MSEVPPAAQQEQQLQKPVNGEPVAVINHLIKQFGKLRAVDDLTMNIYAGETYGLIGPNGSGKTTLIRMLVGLVRPASGTIQILNERIPSSKVAPHIGYMTQLSALYLDLTARENMQFFCNIYGLRGKLQKQRIEEMLERVELADRANEVVGNFSGGMKQRLSLACALVHHPQLALLDEPTVGVDPQLRRSFWDYFAQLNKEGSDPNVASAMHDLTLGFTRQLGVALATIKAQQGHAVPPVISSSIPFTVNDPQYLHGGPQYTFNDSIAPVFIGIFSFFFVFILTSVAFLRERSQGTIERVIVSPLTRPELVVGYICGFTLFALVQSLMILLFVVFALRVHYSGNLALVFLVSALLTIGSVNLGIFLSTFAQNEFQIVQFIPLVLGIQVFLSGVFWPVAQLPPVLRPISYILPLTYANDALRGVMLKGSDFVGIAGQLTALLIFALLMVMLSALTMRRQIA